MKELYVKEIQCRLLGDDGAKVELLQAFRRHHKSAAKRLPRVMVRSVCKIAAKSLRNKALQLRKEHAGALLKTSEASTLKAEMILGTGVIPLPLSPTTMTAYRPVETASPIAMDEHGKCVVANAIGSSENAGSKGQGKQQPAKWACSSECKPVTGAEVDAIVALKQAFEEPMQKV